VLFDDPWSLSIGGVVPASSDTPRFGKQLLAAAAGSGAALLASTVAFAGIYVMGGGRDPILASVGAFVAGAIANAMNRRWSWAIGTAQAFGGHLAISLAALITACVASRAVNDWVKQNIAPHHGVRVAVMTGAFLVVQAAFFLAKFAAFERVAATPASSDS
jgi:hypothetical protein